MATEHASQFVIAGLDPATQCAHVRARWRCSSIVNENCGVEDVRALGGRVKPGHDELSMVLACPFVRVGG